MKLGATNASRNCAVIVPLERRRPSQILRLARIRSCNPASSPDVSCSGLTLRFVMTRFGGSFEELNRSAQHSCSSAAETPRSSPPSFSSQQGHQHRLRVLLLACPTPCVACEKRSELCRYRKLAKDSSARNSITTSTAPTMYEMFAFARSRSESSCLTPRGAMQPQFRSQPKRREHLESSRVVLQQPPETRRTLRAGG